MKSLENKFLMYSFKERYTFVLTPGQNTRIQQKETWKLTESFRICVTKPEEYLQFDLHDVGPILV
jgi:hypothetical protein